MMQVRFTYARLMAWQDRWPGSTLCEGTAYFDDKTGDLVDLSGHLSRQDVDGLEFDAFVDDHQSKALAAVRGKRCA